MGEITPLLRVGEELHGFVVREVTPMPAFKAVAYRLEHPGSGARVLHLHADDAENLFSVTFPTPPPDDTGVPHILEHSVLAGSQRFPVRDPFFEMVKMSMATFINAMTGFDATYYPVSSNVKQDLFNLAEVYFDAVFHPLLTEETFMREAHHLVPANPDDLTGSLAVNGIVYNEMKGYYSQPDWLLYRMTQHLYPDTIYGRDSGGDPPCIPNLTYQELRNFHATYYHPSNAYFFLYGDIPTAEYLAFLEERLAPFSRQGVQPEITRQPAWDAPRRFEEPYPIGPNDPTQAKTYLAMYWKAGDATDPEETVLMHVLSQFLLGNEAAPLRKAIIDSHLGEDLIFCGEMPVGLELMFEVGLQGSERDRRDAFEKLVLDTLAGIAAVPMPHERVEAAFQQAAYEYLEIKQLFPLHLMEHVDQSWYYGGDPLTFLRMQEHLQACRRRYEENPQLFNELIRTRLVDNPHRLTATLFPDRGAQARLEAAFAERMEAVRAGMSAEAVAEVAQGAAELERRSGIPNTPEQLATLPQLQISDLPKAPKQIPTTVESLPGSAVLLHNDVFANGVNYLQIDLNLQGLSDTLWPYVARYADGFSKLGAAGMSYEQIAHRIAASTGGVWCRPGFTTHAADPGHPVWGLRLGCKFLDEQAGEALALLHDLLFQLDPRDRDRLYDVTTQARSEFRTNLVYNGAQTAFMHAVRGLTPEGYLNEMTRGLPQLDLCETLFSQYDREHEMLMDRIEAIRDFVLVRGRVTASFTGSDGAFTRVRETLAGWVGQMREEPILPLSPGFMPYDTPPCEGLAAPIQVAHCSLVMPAPHASHHDEAMVMLGARILGLDHILNEVRFKGNAYGAWCNYDALGRMVALGSYNDPHVARTLGVFTGVSDYIAGTQWTQTEIDRAIIGSAREDEKPIRPEDATGQALRRYLTGQTPEYRIDRFQRIRAATPAAVKHALLDTLQANLPHAAICVVTSREKLEEANAQFGECKLAIEDILKV